MKYNPYEGIGYKLGTHIVNALIASAGCIALLGTMFIVYVL